MVNLVYGTRYTDLCYGYNAFRRECLAVMALDPGDPSRLDDGTMWWGDGFEVETLINVRIAKAGLRVSEVPSFEAVGISARATSMPFPTECGCCTPSMSSTIAASARLRLKRRGLSGRQELPGP